MTAGERWAWILVTCTGAAGAVAQVPYKTRADILRYGATGIGSPYVWGGGNWDPEDRTFGGADCSGFVSKCWSIGKWTPYRVNHHGPSTAGYIQTPGSAWYEVNRSDLLYGDAICYRYNSNQNGHIYIFLSGDGWGEHEVYEARGTAYGIVHRWRTVYSGAEVTKGLRRTNLVENIDVTEHVVETDDGAPYYTDSGMTGASQYDSHALGCRDGECRYHYVTAARNETCTFTPDLPESGRYRVYVTCGVASPNVQGVGVTVHHAMGASFHTWDQGAALGLDSWRPVGDESYLLNAGMSGSVVWDDVDATPMDGSHIFRGDATKFALDNRVEVDGVGGAAGRFATLQSALDWIATHESEEPDVVRITCDTIHETGCIQVNAPDDLLIDGDPDGDGVPATIVVSPSIPADWSRPCALYLDVPIQHAYTLRDIIIIPNYVSAGYSTAAYGLVIDEQNPSGEACGMSVRLDNVTVTGSLPGNLPADPLIDSRALATMFGGLDLGYGAALTQRSSSWAGHEICRQEIRATGLTISHSATHGLALQSAYTTWEIDGGLLVSYSGGAGVRADNIGGSTLAIGDSSGVDRNQIIGNGGGGIVTIGAGQFSVSDTQIRDNAFTNGGGIANNSSAWSVRNCLLGGNTASGDGGAVFAAGGTTVITNSTLIGNESATGAGGVHAVAGAVHLANSIVWNNGVAPIQGDATVLYSDVQGGHHGVGNIDLDPLFAGDSPADCHLLRASPCVNAGDPSFVMQAGERDLDGEARVLAVVVDMGVDEVDYWAGDADRNGIIDLDDYDEFAECFSGPTGWPDPAGALDAEECRATFDSDDDGDIDLADFAVFQLRMSLLSVPDVIIESRDPTGAVTPAPAYVEQGTWSNSTIKSTVPGLFGTGSRYTTYDMPVPGTDHATFVPPIVTSGVYEVLATWDNGANCLNAQYTIQHDNGQTVVYVDQIPDGVVGQNANTWVSLGQYPFRTGQDASLGSVDLSEETVTGDPHPLWNRRVYADAVKWVFVHGLSD